MEEIYIILFQNILLLSAIVVQQNTETTEFNMATTKKWYLMIPSNSFFEFQDLWVGAAISSIYCF